MVSLRADLAGRHVLTLATLLVVADASRASTNLQAWFAAQADTRTWSAEFTQTRTLKALAKPLVTKGQLWFAAPNRFRWELGSPAQTIAVRQSNQVMVIYPELRRAERYELDDAPGNPMRDMLSLLEAGFPRSQSDLEKSFKFLAISELPNECEVRLEPRAPAARRWVKEVVLRLSLATWTLSSSSLQFADGSSLRNDYRDVKQNPPIEPDLFRPEVPPSFKIVGPAPDKRK